MNLDAIPLFSMLKGRLGYLSERQRVISQNVANSDTPGFTPSDMKPFTFKAPGAGGVSGPVAPVMTRPNHLPGPKSLQTGHRQVEAPGQETTLDGNSVSLEEQMMKMTEARINYDAAIGFYQKSLGLLRMAARAPGR